MKRYLLLIPLVALPFAPTASAAPPARITGTVADTMAATATIPTTATVARCGPRGHVCRFVLTTQTGVRCVGRLHLSRGLTGFRCSDEAAIPAFAAGIREFLLR